MVELKNIRIEPFWEETIPPITSESMRMLYLEQIMMKNYVDSHP
jgi:hypothetical protein